MNLNSLRTKVARVVLGFELIAFILATLFLFTMPFDRLFSGIFVTVVALSLLIAVALSSKFFGILMGWFTQLFILVVGFLTSLSVAIFGLIFGALWVYALWSARRKIRLLNKLNQFN